MMKPPCHERFAPYWAYAKTRSVGNSRKGVEVTWGRWGWSHESLEGAQAKAQERLQAAIAKKETRYQETLEVYEQDTTVPIREEILEVKEHLGVVSRNRYGAWCLNTDQVCILDIDTPEVRQTRWDTLFNWFWLFGNAASSALVFFFFQSAGVSIAFLIGWAILFGLIWHAGLRPQLLRREQQRQHTQQQEQLTQRIAKFLEEQPQACVRQYQTPNGYRLMLLGSQNPWDFAQAWIEQLPIQIHTQVDPLYWQLCQRQQLFRARVSAKPWRFEKRLAVPKCKGLEKPLAWEQFVAFYEAQQRDYKACVLQHVAGNPDVITKVQHDVIQWHDALAQVHEDKPMA